MSFSAGSLVRARGREWVVLPESSPDFLMLRPLGGTDDEIAGILLGLEEVAPAQLDPPVPTGHCDVRSHRLLRDAVRLGFRSSAGPFRCFGAIAFEPRPYQIVPLLLALRQDTIRLLIADDVGVGKTIEAGLIAREMLDRGEVERLAVICPPHLAEQWQVELADKFRIHAQLVLPRTIVALERQLVGSQGIFDVFPHVIVSMDFIKADRYREDFLRRCPELVIVDEAHTCAEGTGRQRRQLIQGLARDASRHLVLVTATPHSGNEAAFRSLLEVLDPARAEFVQRRRADLAHFLGTDTPFPGRDDRDETCTMHPEYRGLFERVLDHVRKALASDPEMRRSRWWSALSVARALGSSPAAAAAVLRRCGDEMPVPLADELGRTILDLDAGEEMDVCPEAHLGDRALLDLARHADRLRGGKDGKLQKAAALVGGMVDEGLHPIVFCRFLDTAEYVTDHLRGALRDVDVVCVTGQLPPEEREQRVKATCGSVRRVLVCTDVLSEGINLQELFDAVVHYDLSWSPTRHEQREGRIDRYGQKRDHVRVVTLYGTDNEMDRLVLDLLLTRHRAIRERVGVPVPAPANASTLLEAMMEAILAPSSEAQLLLPGFEDPLHPHRADLFREWEDAAERERESRAVSHGDGGEEVGPVLEAVRACVGSERDVARFVHDALDAHGVAAEFLGDDLRFDLRTLQDSLLLDALQLPKAPHVARFKPPVPEGRLLLTRAHPTVEGLASYVLDHALDPLSASPVRRCGGLLTEAVETPTVLLIVRVRLHVVTAVGGRLLAEDCALLAYQGDPASPVWLGRERAAALLETAGREALFEMSEPILRKALEALDRMGPRLEEEAEVRGRALEAAHNAVRPSARARVEAQQPPDLLGIYAFLPGA